MKIKVLLIAGVILTFAFSSLKEPPFRVPRNWPKPVYDFTNNRLDAKTIELGRMLFYDPILSIDSSTSCSSCHSSFNAFTHVDHALSHGVHDRIGRRNSPALMNLAWQQAFMWDGAVNHLDMQALAPINHPDEMGESTAHMIMKLNRSAFYRQAFHETFNDSLITSERFLKSMSQFLLCLVSANAKYDQVMRGEAEFNEVEKKGYAMFKTHCAACHAEPLFTRGDFANNGLQPDTILKDLGRYAVTNRPSDSLAFKIPTLRNIEFTYPYMHDGRFKTLNQVLNHYTSGIKPSSTQASELRQPIRLSPNEKVELTAFLLCLSDRDFLFNPKFGYPTRLKINQTSKN